MVKIRLMKPGKSAKRRAHFKIVIMERKSARDSKFLEQIGVYNPAQKLLKIDLERYQYWFKRGARPTETVKSLAKRYKKAQKKNTD